MELDKNRITIRQRDFLEVLDLGLRVVRSYAGPLALALAVGIVPMMLLNAWLLSGYQGRDLEGDVPFGYLWYMLLLVLWEMPLATAPATVYLGQSLFMERPRPGKVAAALAASLPQMILLQVLLRGILVLFVVTWFWIFAVWPYLSEVILLERNPLRRTRRQQITTLRRVAALHGGSTGDLFARWLGALGVGFLLVLSFWLSLWTAGGMLLSEWAWESTVYTVYFPTALWLAVAYLSVVRYLAYLDLRIRREGWEVELLMRAEQARLAGQLT